MKEEWVIPIHKSMSSYEYKPVYQISFVLLNIWRVSKQIARQAGVFKTQYKRLYRNRRIYKEECMYIFIEA